MSDFTIKIVDSLQSDITSWESTDPTNITLSHQSTPIEDSEANHERSHKCLKAVVSGDQSGDKIRLPVANFVDGVPSIVANSFFGFWIRASLTGSSVVKAIMSSDGTEVEVTPNIATANKWQFVYVDMDALTGTVDYFELEILATASVDIWVSRVWYCNESRQLSGSTAGITATDEVIELTAMANPSGAQCVFTNCLFLGAYELKMSYTGAHQWKGCYFNGLTNIGSITSYGTFKLIESSVANKFTGTTNSWVEITGYFKTRIYASGFEISNTNFYGLTYTYFSDFTDWDYAYNLNMYGCSYGIAADNYFVGQIKDSKIVGGTYGVWAYYTSFNFKCCEISSVNPPATLDIYIGINGLVNWLIDGSALGFNIASMGMATTDAKMHGLRIFRTANFVTNPVTQNIIVVGYNTKNGSLPTHMPFRTKPFGFKDITDASGKVQLWCLYAHYWNGGNEVYSDGTDKYHFKFISGNEVLATYDGDISSGIATEDSPQSVDLAGETTEPTISNLTPTDGSTTSDRTPTISADYSDASGIDTSTVKLVVDGVDVTTNATVTADSVTYTPTANIRLGIISVYLEVKDTVGNLATKTWFFTAQYVGTGLTAIAVDPWLVIKGIIEDNMVISGWTPSVNSSWFEARRSSERQITLEPTFVDATLVEVGQPTSPTQYAHTFIIGIHAPTRSQRQEMVQEIKRIFRDTDITHNPTYDINGDGQQQTTGITDMVLEEFEPTDKDIKKACPQWRCDVTLRVLYGEDVPA